MIMIRIAYLSHNKLKKMHVKLNDSSTEFDRTLIFLSTPVSVIHSPS